MRILQGERISDGIAIGPVYAYSTTNHQIEKYEVEDVEAECARFQVAKEAAYRQLQGLFEMAVTQVGEDFALIFEMHQLILGDVGLTEHVEKIIREESVCAEYALSKECERQEQFFLSMDDTYLRARSADIRDVAERVIGILTGESRRAPRLKEKSIMLAVELKPSQTIQLDRHKVLGVVTGSGSENSHMAILSRSMGIPAIVCEELGEKEIHDFKGKLAIIDGRNGQLVLDPDEETLIRMEALRDEICHREQDEKQYVGLTDETRTGQALRIYANISGVSDLEVVLEQDAKGIGLLRSEFLFLESEEAPSEEVQYQTYRTILRTMKNKPVVIRTMDIGADKKLPFMERFVEENPALGCRGVRFCLEHKDLFKTQIRAILRAGIYGNAQMLLPMITSVREVELVQEMIKEASEELIAEQIPWRKLPLGVMIETPAAALISDELAKKVDFFSIGTNDLAQYTLAMDRQNKELGAYFDARHPALLKLIEQTIENGHKAGIPVGICGELGSDEDLLPYFLSIGLDEISVSASKILHLRGILRNL